MIHTNSQEKKQSVWSLAIALSLVITVIAPQEISAQNSTSQEITALAQATIQSVARKVLND